MRSWIAATVSFASVVRIVKVSTGGAPGRALSCQLSQRPANAKSGWSAAVIAKGCLCPGSPFHSKKPVAGTTQRLLLNALRNEGFPAAGSLLALIIRLPIARSFDQNGTSPQRSIATSRSPLAFTRTTGASCVGAMLKRLRMRSCTGTLNV